MKFKSDIEVQAGIKDYAGSSGTSGQVLSSDGTTVSWIDGEIGVASDVQNEVKAGVAINKGQAVYVTGADGTNIIVGLASNTSEATSSKTLGLLNATVAINGFADVVQIGRLSGLNTIGANEGDPVWLGQNGNLIYGLANKPYAPLHLVFIGVVTRVNANNGEIFINVQNGFELNEIHDVDIKTDVPINGDILGYNGTLWVNKTIAEWLGYTPANDAEVVKLTGNQTISDVKTFNIIEAGRVTIQPSSGTSAGRLFLKQGTSSGPIGPGYTSIYPLYQNSLSINFAQDDGSLKTATLVAPTDSWSYTFPNKSGTFAMTSDVPTISGTTNYLSKFTSTSTLGNSLIYDNGTNVGIGTTSPAAKLDVNGDIAATQFNLPGVIGYSSIRLSSGEPLGYNGLSFYTGANTGAESMRINGYGNVGIGKINPSAKLDVAGEILSSKSTTNWATVNQIGLLISGSSSGGATSYISTYLDDTSLQIGAGTSQKTGFIINGQTSASGSSIDFRTGGETKMCITSSGSVGIGTTSPSAKLDVNGASILGGDLDYTWAVEVNNIGETGAHGMYVNVGPNSSGVPFAVFKNFNPLFYVGNSGDVGIGTSNPNTKLEVNGYIFSNDGSYAGKMLFGSTFGPYISGNALTGELGLNSSSGSPTLVIDVNSKVGIGTTSPAEKLEIQGNLKVTGQAYTSYSSDTAVTGTKTLNFNEGNIAFYTLTGSTTITLVNAKAGSVYTIKLVQGGSGSNTVIWSPTVKWGGGTTPTLSTAVGAIDIVTLLYDGTNFYGNIVKNFA